MGASHSVDSVDDDSNIQQKLNESLQIGQDRWPDPYGKLFRLCRPDAHLKMSSGTPPTGGGFKMTPPDSPSGKAVAVVKDTVKGAAAKLGVLDGSTEKKQALDMSQKVSSFYSTGHGHQRSLESQQASYSVMQRVTRMSDAEFNKLISRVARNDPDLNKINGKHDIEDMYFKKALTEASEISAARANVWCADRIFVLAAAMRHAHETAKNSDFSSGSEKASSSKGRDNVEGPGLLNLRSLDFSYCNDLVKQYGGTYFADRNNYIEVGNIVSCRTKISGGFGKGFRPLPMQGRVEVARVPQGTVNLMYDDGKIAFAVPKRFVMDWAEKKEGSSKSKDKAPNSMEYWAPLRKTVGRPFYRQSKGASAAKEISSWSHVLTAPIPLADLGPEARRCTQIDILVDSGKGVAHPSWSSLPKDFGIKLAARLFGPKRVDATSFLLAPLACTSKGEDSVQYRITMYWFPCSDNTGSQNGGLGQNFHSRRIVLQCVYYDKSENAESPFLQLVSQSKRVSIIAGEASADNYKEHISASFLREKVKELYDDWGARRLVEYLAEPDYGSRIEAEKEDANQLSKVLGLEAGFDAELFNVQDGGPKLTFREFVSERKANLSQQLDGKESSGVPPVLASLALPANVFFQKFEFNTLGAVEHAGEWQVSQNAFGNTTKAAILKRVMHIMELRQGRLVEAAMKRGILQELFVVPTPIGSDNSSNLVCRVAHRVDKISTNVDDGSSVPTAKTRTSTYTLMFSDGAIEYDVPREHFVLAAPKAKGELAFFDATPEIEGLTSQSVLRLEGNIPIPSFWNSDKESSPILRMEGKDNDGNMRIVSMEVDGIDLKRDKYFPTQCRLKGRLSDGGSSGFCTGVIRILPDVNEGDRVITSEPAGLYHPATIHDINDNTYSVQLDDGTIRRLPREQIWLDRTAELTLAQISGFEQIQSQQGDHKFYYPSEPLQDGTDVLVRIDLLTGMPSEEGTQIVHSCIATNGAILQEDGSYNYTLVDFQDIIDGQAKSEVGGEGSEWLRRGTHINAFYPLPPRECLDTHKVSIELLVAERTDRIPFFRVENNVLKFPTEDASGRPRNSDLPHVDGVAYGAVPGFFCSASEFLKRMEPRLLNYDEDVDGNLTLRPSVTGLKGRDAAYGSYGLYFDEKATILGKKKVPGCSESAYVYDILLESSGNTRYGVPRHQFWIEEEPADEEMTILKVGTAVLIRASPRDPETGQLKVIAGISPAKTCFYGIVNGPPEEDPRDPNNTLVKVIFVRPGLLSSGIIEEERFTASLAETARLGTSCKLSRFEQDCIMCECLISRRDLQPFSQRERIECGWRVSVSRYGNSGRSTREFGQPLAREWWRTADLIQSHVPISSEGKSCLMNSDVAYDMDLCLNGSAEILRHCNLDTTIMAEPGLRVLAFPNGWPWESSEFVPADPYFDSRNSSGRETKFENAGKNNTAKLATIVNVTTSEEAKAGLKFRQELQDLGITEVQRESNFEKDLAHAPYCTVEFDDPKPDEGVKVVVVQSKSSEETYLSLVVSSLREAEEQFDETSQSKRFVHTAHGYFDSLLALKTDSNNRSSTARKPAKISLVINDAPSASETATQRMERITREIMTEFASKEPSETLFLYLFDDEFDSLSGINIPSYARKRVLSMKISTQSGSDRDMLPTLDFVHQKTVGCICELRVGLKVNVETVLVPVADFSRYCFRKEHIPIRGNYIYPISASSVGHSNEGTEERRRACIKKGGAVWSQRIYNASIIQINDGSYSLKEILKDGTRLSNFVRVHPDRDLINAEYKVSTDSLRELLLQCRTAVRELKLNHAYLGDKDFKFANLKIVESLSDLVRDFSSSFNLQSNSLGQGASSQYFLPPLRGATVNWGGFFRTQPVLHTLELSDIGLMERGAILLCRGLITNRSISRLLLDQNAIRDKGAAAVSTVLSIHPKLTYLDMSANMLTSKSAFSLARALSQYRIAQIIGSHQSLIVKRVYSALNNNTNPENDTARVSIGTSEQAIWLRKGMKVLVEIPDDDNKTLFSMKYGTVTADQPLSSCSDMANTLVEVMLDRDTNTQLFSRSSVHIPWRELQKWSSEGLAQDDVAAELLHRGLALWRNKLPYKAIECLKLAMEERCKLGIHIKTDLVWNKAIETIHQIVKDAGLGSSPPVCHRVSHHQICRQQFSTDHYAYVPRKKTVHAFLPPSQSSESQNYKKHSRRSLMKKTKESRWGILRHIPNCEKNRESRLGVVLYGEADGAYHVHLVNENKYTREQVEQSSRVENGEGGFKYAKDMKLRKLNGNYFLVWDECDDTSTNWRDDTMDNFKLWSNDIKVLELKGDNKIVVSYKELKYENDNTKKFRKNGVYPGTCVITPTDSESEMQSDTRQVYLVRRRIYTEEQFAQGIRYPASEYTSDMQMYYRVVKDSSGKRAVDAFGRSCIPFKVIEWRGDGTCEVEECGEIVTVSADECLKRDAKIQAKASTPGMFVILPVRFALSEVEMMGIGVTYDVMYIAQKPNNARMDRKRSSSMAVDPFFASGSDIEENVDSHRIRSLEGTFLGIGATVEVLKTSRTLRLGSDEAFSRQGASSMGYAPSSLKSLILDENRLVGNSETDVNLHGIVALLHACAGSGVLEHLSLSHTQLGNEGATAIAQVLAHPHNRCSMRTLDLSNCNIDTAGYKSILCMLCANRYLKKVELANNLIYETWDDKSVGFHFYPETWPEDSPWKAHAPSTGNSVKTGPAGKSMRSNEEQAMGGNVRQNLLLKTLRDMLIDKPTMHEYKIKKFISSHLLSGKVTALKYDKFAKKHIFASSEASGATSKTTARKASRRKSSVDLGDTLIVDPFKSPEGNAAVLFAELSLGVKAVPDSSWEYEPRCPMTGVKFTNELLYLQYKSARSEKDNRLAKVLLEHQRRYTKESLTGLRRHLSSLVVLHFNEDDFPKNDLHVAQRNAIAVIDSYIGVGFIVSHEQIEAAVLFLKKIRLEQVREIKKLEFNIQTSTDYVETGSRDGSTAGALQAWIDAKEIELAKPNLFDQGFDTIKFDLKYGADFDAAVGVATIRDVKGAGCLTSVNQRNAISKMLNKQDLPKRGLQVALGDDNEGADDAEAFELTKITLQTPNNAWIYAYRKAREPPAERDVASDSESPPLVPKGGGAYRWRESWREKGPSNGKAGKLWYNSKLMRAEVSSQVHIIARRVTLQCLQMQHDDSSSISEAHGELQNISENKARVELQMKKCNELQNSLHSAMEKIPRLLKEKESAQGNEAIIAAKNNLEFQQHQVNLVGAYLQQHGKSIPAVNIASSTAGLHKMKTLIEEVRCQLSVEGAKTISAEKKALSAPGHKERKLSRQRLMKYISEAQFCPSTPHDVANLKYSREPYQPKIPSPTTLPSSVLALRMGGRSDSIDGSAEALWYYLRMGANFIRLFLEAEGDNRGVLNHRVYLVDTPTRRLISLLTGTANIQLKDDPADDPSKSEKFVVDWDDRIDRLIMFGRLIDSLSPINFSRVRTPLTDPI